jgi:hypothetical protein
MIHSSYDTFCHPQDLLWLGELRVAGWGTVAS